MTTLLERERELAELRAMVAEAHAGEGRLVVIEAQAGLGKTSLLEAVRECAARAGMRVLGARATELERDFPFALVRQLFEPELMAMDAPERDAVFDGASAAARGAVGLAEDGPLVEQDTFTVLYGLYWLTAALAERCPLLLAVDDAHWSDAASLEYLGFLLPRLEELAVLLVVACRPREAGQQSTLAGIAADTLARRLAPSALSRASTTMLLGAELGVEPDETFAATCYELSGGNPFLLCELSRTLAEQGVRPGAEEARTVRQLAPERVIATVQLRLARLSPRAQTVARALAVLGDHTEPRLLAALAELDLDATLQGADALRAAAIFDAETPLRFIHPLVLNAVYSEMSAGERASAHTRAAALLRSQGASSENVAVQLLASDARGERETAETLLVAATRALARGAPQSAITYLTRALGEPPPPDLRAAVIRPLITASVRASDGSALVPILADVITGLERDPRMLIDSAAELATWMALSGRLDQARALLERAIEAAAGEDDIDRAVQLEAQLIFYAQLPPAEARARFERYRGRLVPDSAGERLALALNAVWDCLTGANATQASQLARRALHAGKIFAEQPGIPAPAHAVLVLVLADELDAAELAAEQALASARQRGATPGLSAAWYLRGCVAMARGNLAAADADARQAVNLARPGAILPPLVTSLLVDILRERGELEAAEAELLTSGMAGAIPDTFWFAPPLLSRGSLRLAQGRTDQAAEDLIELWHRIERWGISGSGGLAVQATSSAAVALAALGERERALALADKALVHARLWGAPSAISTAQRGLGLAIGGPPGIQLLRQAVAVLEDSPACLARAHALSELGAALRRANRRSEARQPLREALELARKCGATGLAKRAHDELRASGEKVPRYTPIGVESLTPSERRVAEMAASGLTNRQIAQTLFVTIKTTETHLSAAYDKLAIRSRQQLADALGEQADDPLPLS